MIDVNRRCYGIPIDGHRVDLKIANLAAVLGESLAMCPGGILTIREPVVIGNPSQWPPRSFHDGTTLGVGRAVGLVESMLTHGDFWCRLESDPFSVHVGEEFVYLTVDPGLVQVVELLEQSGIGSWLDHASPYGEKWTVHPYEAIDDEFWLHLASDHPALILQQWAAGRAGERWYKVASSEDVRVVKGDLIPGSILAVFSQSTLYDLRAVVEYGFEAALGVDYLFGNLRFFRPGIGPVKVDLVSVANEEGVQEVFLECPVGVELFNWSDTTCEVTYRANPESDGIVRTGLIFD